MASPLVCVVYVYKQFIRHHYIILSVSLTVEKWQLDGVLTDATEGGREREGESVCERKKGSERHFFFKNYFTFPSEAHQSQ